MCIRDRYQRRVHGILIMKKVLIGLTTLAGVGIGLHKYYSRKFEVVEFPQQVWAFKELQCCYKDVRKPCTELHGNLKKKIADQYQDGSVKAIHLSYDNPEWLVRKEDCRSATGIVMDPATAENPKIQEALQAEGLKQKIVPKFSALSLHCPYPIGSGKWQLYLWIMISGYLCKYHKQMRTIPSFTMVLGEKYTQGNTYYFIPTPDNYGVLNIISTPPPELNEKGRKARPCCRPQSEPTFISPCTLR
eukprot:TRINITY_DN57777_c0_g1_i1.p1 TRINITY_DN57777_c0_g1~~TRINITY_DN57777_c0_g1_i1.p1  ORF type:complete len:246 (+),score=34.96 TRINITY_DN57777_c0_g1_i1:132-869(+)